jgi:RHS repeat-associated protein
VYDALDRVSELEHRYANGSLLSNYTFSYDEASRLTSEERDSVLRTYGYDTTNQLVRDNTAATITYDGTGNRTTDVTPAAGNRLASDATWSSYSYDEEGNVTGKSNATDTWVYEYDHRNQLTSASRSETGGGLQLRVDYKYDVFGNIVERTLDSDGDENVDTTERYALDGWKVLQGPLGDRRELRGNENWDVWADLDQSSSLTIRYEHGDAIDQVFARLAAGGQERWLLQDRLGSVREVTDDGGSLLTSVTYDAFGNHATTPTSDLGRYQFTGRDKDAELDLQRNRARFYDPKSGRWISHDPLGFDAGDSNLYRYVNNEPLAFGDPSGLQVRDPLRHGVDRSDPARRDEEIRRFNQEAKANKKAATDRMFDKEKDGLTNKQIYIKYGKEYVAKREREKLIEEANIQEARDYEAALSRFYKGEGTAPHGLSDGSQVTVIDNVGATRARAAVYYKNLSYESGDPSHAGGTKTLSRREPFFVGFYSQYMRTDYIHQFAANNANAANNTYSQILRVGEKAVDILQAGLDIVGVIPGIGEFADVVNGRTTSRTGPITSGPATSCASSAATGPVRNAASPATRPRRSTSIRPGGTRLWS